MNIVISDQVPKGEDLTRAVDDLEVQEQARLHKEQIRRGLEASKDSTSPRTKHDDFMAELKTELMSRINAR